MAERNGWSVIDVFCDNDVSAYRGKPRPEYQRLLDAIVRGVIDVVVVWHTDRLHRSPVELEHYINTCEPRAVATHTVQAGLLDLTTPSGRFGARVHGAVSSHESEHKGARQRAKAAHDAANGLPFPGGRRAFGYEADGLTLIAREAELVPAIYERFLASRSLLGVVRWLNAQGVPTTRGKPWASNTVSAVLRNPKYMGVRGMRPVINTRTGTRSPFYEEMGRGSWPALVSEETWRAVLKILKDPDRRTNKIGTARKYLLGGLAECWCGAKVKCGRDNVRYAGEHYVRCSVSPHLHRRGQYIADYVVEQVWVRLRDPDAREVLLAQAADVDVAAAVRDAEVIRGRLDELAADYASGEMSRAEYQAARAAGRTRLDELDTVIASAGSADPVLRFIESGLDPADAWDELGLDGQRAVIDRLVRIRILPGKGGRPGGRRFDPESVELIWRAD